MVMALGTGPGLNLDLATFSFHVPARPFGACAPAPAASAITIIPTIKPKRLRGRRDPIPHLLCVFARRVGKYCPAQPFVNRKMRIARIRRSRPVSVSWSTGGEPEPGHAGCIPDVGMVADEVAPLEPFLRKVIARFAWFPCALVLVADEQRLGAHARGEPIHRRIPLAGGEQLHGAALDHDVERARTHRGIREVAGDIRERAAAARSL